MAVRVRVESRSESLAAGAALFLGACLALIAVTFRLNRAFYQDDAYIVLHYAQNILAGHGAVWNPGEYVQGYTSFLHLCAVTLLGRLGLDLAFASRALGVAAYAGLVAVLASYLRESSPASESPLTWRIPFALVAGSSPLVVWSLGGLETVPVALLVTSGCVLLLRAEGPAEIRLLAGSGACFALGFLARPDASLFGAVALLASLPEWRARGRALRNALAFSLPIAGIAFPYVAWELWYYGDFVPNTFHAKLGGNVSFESLFRGARYLASYSLRPPFLPLLAVAALAVEWRAGRLRAPELRLAAMCAAYAGFVVFAGGDAMASFRFAVPLVAPLALVVFLCAQRWDERAVRWFSAAVLVLSFAQLGSARLNPRVEDGAAKFGSIVGRYIARAWPPGSLVALSTAGSPPYFASDLRYVDMLGLNDAVIGRRDVGEHRLAWQSQPGHMKGDGAYVLERRPDYIILGGCPGTTADQPLFLSDYELAHDPRFARDYQLVRVLLSPKGREVARSGIPFTYYRRSTAAPEPDAAAAPPADAR
ncbi:MAG TPA: hypothetical protein VEN47_12415 [Myxococcota bacterium]|nr:hypothetical protein [Myxococcota bacterium]